MPSSWSKVVAGAGIALAVACTRTPKVPQPPATRTAAAPAPAAPTASAAQIADQVQVVVRERDIVYRAPTLSSVSPVTGQFGGPVLGSGFEGVEAGRFGFLVGIRNKQTNAVRTMALFQSDFVAGKGRYAAVTLADGTSLPFHVASTNRGRCKQDCVLVYEAIEVDLPDAALRNVPADGLALRIRLDNGYEFTVRAPADYVRGYLMAVDRPA